MSEKRYFRGPVDGMVYAVRCGIVEVKDGDRNWKSSCYTLPEFMRYVQTGRYIETDEYFVPLTKPLPHLDGAGVFHVEQPPTSPDDPRYSPSGPSAFGPPVFRERRWNCASLDKPSKSYWFQSEPNGPVMFIDQSGSWKSSRFRSVEQIEVDPRVKEFFDHLPAEEQPAIAVGYAATKDEVDGLKKENAELRRNLEAATTEAESLRAQLAESQAAAAKMREAILFSRDKIYDTVAKERELLLPRTVAIRDRLFEATSESAGRDFLERLKRAESERDEYRRLCVDRDSRVNDHRQIIEHLKDAGVPVYEITLAVGELVKRYKAAQSDVAQQKAIAAEWQAKAGQPRWSFTKHS